MYLNGVCSSRALYAIKYSVVYIEEKERVESGKIDDSGVTLFSSSLY